MSVSTVPAIASEPRQAGYLSHKDTAAAPVDRFRQRQTLLVGNRPQRLPSAPLCVADASIAFTEPGQHRDRQSFDPGFPVRPVLCAVPPGHLTLSPDACLTDC
jgi:hypothetical protein